MDSTPTRRAAEPPITEAERRAVRIWQEFALYVRGEARVRGVTGALRYLDDTVQGKRGRAAPQQICALARQMRGARLPLEIAQARAAQAARDLIALEYATDRRSTRRA